MKEVEYDSKITSAMVTVCEQLGYEPTEWNVEQLWDILVSADKEMLDED